MKTIHLYILLLGSLLLASCEKLVTDVDVPAVEPQLVVFSFISPESDVVKVQLSLSQPIYGKPGYSNTFINDAIVTITNDGGQTITIPFVDSAGVYMVSSAEFPVQAGRTYYLTASTNNGSKKVKSQCTVPGELVSFSEVTYKKTASAGSNTPQYVITYKWNDDASKTNYYRTSSGAEAVGDFGGNYSYEFCTDVYDDRTYNGKTITASCEIGGYYGESPTIDANVVLLNTDNHYYEYHRRRLNYFGDDPFSEPFPQYTNMEGGLGVFCAYRRSMINITLQ